MRLAAVLAIAIAFHAPSAQADYFIERIPLRHPELPAIADENLPPRPEGMGWRRVTNFGGPTDSTCLGNPKTPLCAVDTRYACWAMRDRTLCGIAWSVPISRKEQSTERWPDFGSIIDYKVIGIGPFKQSDFPSNMWRRWIPKKGDLLAGLAKRHCTFMEYSEIPVWECTRYRPIHQEMYHLRRVRGLWQIIAYETTRYYDYPIDPETGLPGEE